MVGGEHHDMKYGKRKTFGTIPMTSVLRNESSAFDPDLNSRMIRTRDRAFFGWCLRREATRGWNYTVLLVPLLVAGYCMTWISGEIDRGNGKWLLQTLFGVAATFVLIGGIRHASKAVCWEVSNESRDLVRLTGIDPIKMLWLKSCGCWWTVFLSLFLMTPLFLFARTLGAVALDLWVVGFSWLLLLFALTAGFAMVASVSSNRVSNPETTAATATFFLLLVYHFLFWGFGTVASLILWLGEDAFFPAQRNWVQAAIPYVFRLAPISGFVQGFISPSIFSPLDPGYWIHFFTAGVSMWGASIVIRQRFRVTKRGDEEIREPMVQKPRFVTPVLMRPRCTDRPFFWKDVYILGGGNWSRSWWIAMGLLAAMGMVSYLVGYGATAHGALLPVGLIAICVTPCVIAFRFDALLTPEFRDKTWDSLMLLPFDPRFILLEKLKATAWERIGLFLPVTLAAGGAITISPTIVLTTTLMATLVGCLLINLTIINQFYAKKWWLGPLLVIAIVAFIGILIPVCGLFPSELSFLIAVLLICLMIGGLSWHIDYRLRRWTDG